MFRVSQKSILSLACMAVAVCASVGAAQAKASKFSVLHSFASGSSSGAYPRAGLVRDAAGNFYGTTHSGGATGAGTVFELSSGNVETVLYAFTDASDGGIPFGNLILDAENNLYGTASAGGDPTCNCGVVFKVTSAGVESVLHTFLGGSGDGATPNGGLVMDRHGNLYGTTESGGGTCNCGTVFKLAPSGTLTLLHAFTGGSDGADPRASLLMDGKRNLYGASDEGGDATCNCGTIFEVDASGSESIRYAFTGSAHGDGANPQTSLILDRKGNLYGTTRYGGTGNGGTVFQLAPDNTETVLHNFAGGSDGATPFAGVVAGMKGNLYGTTQEGGSANAGTIYRVTTTGQETVLHSFNGGSDGDQPFSTLILDSDGNLYGTAEQGGAHGYGTVFEMKRRR